MWVLTATTTAHVYVMTQRVTAYVFEYGGGIVTGTGDVGKARRVMRKEIRSRWEGIGPFSWPDYDFTHTEPVVEHGRWVPDIHAGGSRWVPLALGANSRGTTVGVVWRT